MRYDKVTGEGIPITRAELRSAVWLEKDKTFRFKEWYEDEQKHSKNLRDGTVRRDKALAVAARLLGVIENYPPVHSYETFDVELFIADLEDYNDSIRTADGKKRLGVK